MEADIAMKLKLKKEPNRYSVNHNQLKYKTQGEV